MSQEKEVQSKIVVILLAIFVPLGIHRLLMGYSNWWLQLLLFFVCGIGSIWCLVDAIRIATGSMKMADGRELN